MILDSLILESAGAVQWAVTVGDNGIIELTEVNAQTPQQLFLQAPNANIWEITVSDTVILERTQVDTGAVTTLVLKADDYSLWKVLVDNSGILSTTETIIGAGGGTDVVPAKVIRKLHDTLPYIEWTLVDGNGQPVNLEEAQTIKFIYRLADAAKTTTLTRTPKVILPALNAGVRYAPLSGNQGDFLTPGLYWGEFEVTYNDGSVITFPNSRYFEVTVMDDLG